MRTISIFFSLIISLTVSAQFGNNQPGNQWNADWITVPEAGESSPGLYLFRKALTVDEVPDSFVVYVSGDNRYKLYVNEKLVSLGPALGDLSHWNYETVDLTPYLKAGNNIIAALVWNEGNLKPVSQFSYRTGFIVQGANEASQVLNTNTSWKCIQDMSYTPIRQSVRGYYAAGAGDKIDMNYQETGWRKVNFDDNHWKQAKPVFESKQGHSGSSAPGGWTLVPSSLPQMELTLQRLPSLRKAEGITIVSSFPAEKDPVRIPANSNVKLLLDQTFLTNAYPTLIFSEGKNSTIVITYAEGLYDSEGNKNNRDEIEGKTISGRQDTIISDGAMNQDFTALNWRTYRYVELNIETRETPLTIEDFYGTFTGYPFEMNAGIETDNDEIYKMMDIGWRTARLCAVETYMDCPYYERLQYIGDTRIQLVVSYYNSGDNRLPKYALDLMDYSRQKDGITFSRYPDSQGQIIPTYSLWYISTLHDYLMYGKDHDFIKDKLFGTRQIMNYFISFTDADGSLKNVPGWNYTDWAPGWIWGTGPVGVDGSSALMDLQLLLALQSAKDLELNEGSEDYAFLYDSIAGRLAETIKNKYWDSSRNLFADTPEKDKFSQHTNSLAILAGLAEGQQAMEMGRSMLTDPTLVQASIYFSYYLHLALTKAGLGDEYLSWLDVWRKNIALGLTTWGETSEVESTRSDCHAWGASPNIEFFRTILGIDSDAPYFSKVKIEPHLGSIQQIGGEMPHPDGKISVQYNIESNTLSAEINLPDNVEGSFVWKGESYILNEGENNYLLATGKKEIQISSGSEEVLIFPNPCNNQLHLLQLKPGLEIIYLVNLDGKILQNIQRNEISETNPSIDTSKLQEGLYYLIFKGRNKTEYRKFIKL